MHSIYFVRGVPGYIKIGRTGNVKKRVAELQTAHPLPLEIVAEYPAAPSVERAFHEALADYRVCGEWFLESPVAKVLYLLVSGARPETRQQIEYLKMFDGKAMPCAEDARNAIMPGLRYSQFVADDVPASQRTKARILHLVQQNKSLQSQVDSLSAVVSRLTAKLENA